MTTWTMSNFTMAVQDGRAHEGMRAETKETTEETIEATEATT